MCRMNVVTSTCVGQVRYVRRAGMWPSSRSAEKPANKPVTSLAGNHVHFNVRWFVINSINTWVIIFLWVSDLSDGEDSLC